MKPLAFVPSIFVLVRSGFMKHSTNKNKRKKWEKQQEMSTIFKYALVSHWSAKATCYILTLDFFSIENELSELVAKIMFYFILFKRQFSNEWTKEMKERKKQIKAPRLKWINKCAPDQWDNIMIKMIWALWVVINVTVNKLWSANHLSLFLCISRLTPYV